MMATGEKKLPQFVDNSVADTGKSKERISRWKLALLGFFAAFVVLSYRIDVAHVIHWRQGGRQLALPHRLSPKVAERAFLHIPNAESAFQTSRKYATHPHLAGSTADFEDAKTLLSLFQTEFHIRRPHTEPVFPAGSKESRDATLGLTSKPALGRKKKKGPTAWIDVYYPVLNTPLNRSLSIVNDQGSVEWEADLEEEGDMRDPEANMYRTSVPVWHGLSKDGDITGELVYANYGNQEDYAQLVAAGTNFTGKIVLARYGGLFRGLKIKGAQELGAAGVLIYSDPRDDGYVTMANGYVAYPGGPARNPTSVQRGSVQYLSMYPGDPTTPGYPSYKDANRTEGTNIPAIPSLPISWANARRLLEEIGDVYLEDERGNKRLTGKASQKRVRLVNHVDNKVTPIWNTMAAIPGHIKDEVVVIGNHRDAWVMGAADPSSGTVSLHEIVKGLGHLLRIGWTPLRTIIIASWDAEEYGLIGSTEWAEDFSDWIAKNVAAYLNVDVSVSGSRWNAQGSPSLAHLIKEVALVIDHPTSPGKTLWDAREDEGPWKGFNLTIDKEFAIGYGKLETERQAHKTSIAPLGSGSDFTAFLQHIGVASADQGFSFTASDAVYHYHSIYDSQHWQEVYGDPGFYRHVAVAKHLGLMGLRLSDSLLIPLNTTQYASELGDYLARVESLVEANLDSQPDFTPLREAISNVQTASTKLDKEKQEALEAFEKLLKHLPPYPSTLLHNLHGRRHTCKSRLSGWSPPPQTFGRRFKDWVKSIFGFPSTDITAASWDVAKLFSDDTWESVLEYAHATLNDDSQFPPWLPGPVRRFIEAARRLGRSNKKLIAFERGFISEGGIKDREWYKHLGVAPGKWLGYGATTFPALTEAITIEKDLKLAEYEVGRLAELINKLAETIVPV